MPRLARTVHPLADQRGTTLIDLLLVAALSTVVLGAVLGFVAASARHNLSTTARVDAIDRASFGLERIENDLRQALEIGPAQTVTTRSAIVDLRRWVRTASTPAQHWIRIDCTETGTIAGTHACTRRDVTAGTPPARILDGISGSTAIFTLRPRPASGAAMAPVDISVVTQAKGRAHVVTLQSTVTPRNCADGIPSGETTCPG